MNRKNCILMMLLGVTFAISAYGWDLPLSVDVSEISFNHNRSSTSTDGINIRINSSTPVLAPEWSNGSQTKKFAYIRNTSAVEQPTVKVKFYCADYDTTYDTTPLTIFALFVAGDSMWNLNDAEVNFHSSTSDVTDFSTGDEIFSNSVGIYNVSWAWRISEINGVPQVPSIYIDATSNDYFVVLNEPILPQSEPWVGVLEKACAWANATESTDNCRNALVSGLYDYAEYSTFSHSGDSGSILLTNLLNDFNNGTKTMDCRDFSNFINVLLSTQGISSRYRIYLDEIKTNCVLPAKSLWGMRTFGSHQISWYNNTYVIDASLMIDNDANPRSSPYDPLLPSGDIDYTDYMEQFSDDDFDFGDDGPTTIN